VAKYYAITNARLFFLAASTNGKRSNFMFLFPRLVLNRGGSSE